MPVDPSARRIASSRTVIHGLAYTCLLASVSTASVCRSLQRVRRQCHHWCVSRRALSFGSVAAAYERYRPGYPDQLVDTVLSYAELPIRNALEIGSGTGKATRAFAARGIAITATDPDPAML